MIYKLNDNVLRRIVQIVQEGMLTGTDVADHMRMIRLTPSSDNQDSLILTDEYLEVVQGQHDTLLREVDTVNDVLES
jgi:hypothetical protein